MNLKQNDESSSSQPTFNIDEFIFVQKKIFQSLLGEIFRRNVVNET